MFESQSNLNPAAGHLRVALLAVLMTWTAASSSLAQTSGPHRHTIRLSDGRQAHFDEWTIDSENQRITLIRFSNQIEIRRAIPLSLLTADDQQTFGAPTNRTTPSVTTMPPDALGPPAMPRSGDPLPNDPSEASHTTRRFPLDLLEDQVPALPPPPSTPAGPENSPRPRPRPALCGNCSTRSVLIGIEPGPLSAYEHLLAPYFPAGIPRSEVPFARTLGRQLMLEQAFPPTPPSRQLRSELPTSVLTNRCTTGPRPI